MIRPKRIASRRLKAAESAKDDETPSDAPKKADDKEKSESCTCNTDRVDREIKKLKKKQAELEQKISNSKDNPDERAKLEKQLAQVESLIGKG